MKLIDRAEVGRVVIGRRVQYRRVNGTSTKRPSKHFVALYTNRDGGEQVEGLETDSQSEAIRLAQAIDARLREAAEQAPAAPPPTAPRVRGSRAARSLTVRELIAAYLEFSRTKQLARKTVCKYTSDLDVLMRYCVLNGIEHAIDIDERAYHRYNAWLDETPHKQGASYSPKSKYGKLTVLKQMLKWAWREKMLPEYTLSAARIPRCRAREQPCPTLEQVESIAARMDRLHGEAVLVLAYTGLRVNELVQLRVNDVVFREDVPTKLHVRRGGSHDGPKDRDHRFVPVHPRIRPILAERARGSGRVMPGLRDRRLLLHLKRAAREAGVPGRQTVHGLRHCFVSTAAASNVPYRMVLSWVGHSSSAILDQYFHTYERASESAMDDLAAHTARVWGDRSR